MPAKPRWGFAGGPAPQLVLVLCWFVALPRGVGAEARTEAVASVGSCGRCRSRPAHRSFLPLPISGLGYDPYNPELPKPPVQRENGALGRGDEPRSDILELELVNQAIEAVRSEVELEQRRYQELLETAREHSSAEAPAVAPHGPAACPAAGLDEDTFPLSFDYNPGGRPSLSGPDASYQPSPLAAAAEAGSKYSLASLGRAQGRGAGGGGTLEYVPKAVSQPQRHSRPVPSSKYVLDDSKPSTDLEYDPLSNFSARLLSRASSKDDRAPKRPRGSRGSEPYTPALKKPCDPFAGCDARFSDSDDEAAATPAVVPVAPSPPRAQAGPESKAPGQSGSREGRDAEEGGLRETKEMAVQYDVEDLGQPPREPGGTPVAKPSSPARTAREPSGSKQGRPKKKKSGAPPAPGHKDGIRKKDRGKDGERGRPAGKPCADRKGPQAGGPRHRAELPEGTKKKPSSATPVASSGKSRPDRGSVPQLPNRTGGKTASGKLAERKARSLDEGAPRDAPKLQKRALSHADLFGDESEDEGPGPVAPPTAPPRLSSTSDSDSDSDSSLGGSAARGPRKRLKAPPPARPAPASPSSCSSSSSSSSAPAGSVDYSALEKEVDFDSDPMEECLRIFNESTSVKTEDRGRLARQVGLPPGALRLRGHPRPRERTRGLPAAPPSPPPALSTRSRLKATSRLPGRCSEMHRNQAGLAHLSLPLLRPPNPAWPQPFWVGWQRVPVLAARGSLLSTKPKLTASWRVQGSVRAARSSPALLCLQTFEVVPGRFPCLVPVFLSCPCEWAREGSRRQWSGQETLLAKARVALGLRCVCRSVLGNLFPPL